MAEIYDFEECLRQLPPIISESETYITSGIPRASEVFTEGAKASGAANLIKDTRDLTDNLAIAAKLFGNLLGDDGDAQENGTIKGFLNSMKKQDAVLNG